MQKKIICLLLLTVLVMGIIPFHASAENPENRYIYFRDELARAPETEPTDSIVVADLSASVCDVNDNSFDEVEPNNDYYLADHIYNDYTVYGSLSLYDVDLYKFTLSSTSVISLTSVSGYSGTVCGVFDSSENCIAVSSFYGYTSTGNASHVLTKTLSSGTYYLCLLNQDEYTDSYVFYFSFSGAGSAHSHSYTATGVTPPTCSVDGYTTYSCSCGASYTSDIVSATGSHQYGSFISDNNGSIDSQGTKTAYCINCGHEKTVADEGVYLPDVVMLEPNGHVTGNILYWNALEGADLYQVFYLKNGTWELLTNTRGTAYKDTTAPVGIKTYYKVRARKGNLMSSMAIPSVAVTRPAPVTSLDNVTITNINPHTTGNIIYWDAVANAKLYQVLRLNNGVWELLKNTGSTAFKDETAPVGVKSYYKIVARNGDIKSNIATTTSASAVRPAPITSLGIVTITEIVGHKTGNIIYWTAVPNAKLYQVFRLNNGAWELLKNTGGTAYKDEDVSCGIKYYYKIIARNDAIKSDITKTTSGSVNRIHDWSNATCTEPKTCRNCETTSGDSLGHLGSGVICERCGGSTFETLVFDGYGDALIQNVSMPHGSYLITVCNYNEDWRVFTYLYNMGESSYEKGISTEKYSYSESIYTGSLDGYIEVNCIDEETSWIITIERVY